LGDWQRNELAGASDLAVLVAMHENKDKQPPVPANLDRWQAELDFSADAMLLDYGRVVIDAYMDANPGPRYTQAITVFIDKHMRIRYVGGTYEVDLDANLQLLQELLAEE
jgi:hypothetical protein